MKEFLKSFVASILAMVFIFLVFIMIVAVVAVGDKPEVKKGSYLVIDIYGDILAYNPPEEMMAKLFGGEPETVHRILGNLEKAAVDDRIDGVILKVSASNTLGSASIEEIRAAIKKVRAADKKVYAYSDWLDRQGLFLASACDSIFMPLASELVFTGFSGTRQYVAELFAKIDVEPNLHRIAEYKSAAELVLRSDMSPETREMMGWLYDDLWDSQMTALAEDRELSRDRLVEYMEYALFLSAEAKEAGLIDEIGYWDDLENRLKDEDDDYLRTVSQATYGEIERSDVGLKGKKKIAVIHAQGSIGGRSSRVDPMLGVMMGHSTIGGALRSVRLDDDIDAVVFRIDSPGGSSLASDLISHEVEVLAKEKPVVASMLDVAASGGYHLAYKANKIVADPMTITGSIGSISGKLNVAGAYNKIGITFDSASKGPNGDFWSGVKNFTPEQWSRFEENHWQGFDIWLKDVSQRRDIPLPELEKLAMGRVWTGRQAVDNGLVDELGGLERAIELAKELADIDADDEVTLVHYPKSKSFFEMLSEGDGFSLNGLMRWAAYRVLRHDLQETMSVMSQRANVIEPR